MKIALLRLAVVTLISVLCAHCAAAQNANPSSRSLTSLEREFLDAVKVQDVERVRELLNRGVSPNFFAPDGPTPLKLAIGAENFELIQSLVETRADVNQISGRIVDMGPAGRRYTQSSPLGMAIAIFRFDIAKYLIEHGADPNLIVDSGAGTPPTSSMDDLVAMASRNRFPGALEALRAALEHGGDPNAGSGGRLIGTAVWMENEKVIGLLACFGARSVGKQQTGYSTIDVVVEEDVLSGEREWTVIRSRPYGGQMVKQTFSGTCH